MQFEYYFPKYWAPEGLEWLKCKIWKTPRVRSPGQRVLKLQSLALPTYLPAALSARTYFLKCHRNWKYFWPILSLLETIFLNCPLFLSLCFPSSSSSSSSLLYFPVYLETASGVVWEEHTLPFTAAFTLTNDKYGSVNIGYWNKHWDSDVVFWHQLFKMFNMRMREFFGNKVWTGKYRGS